MALEIVVILNGLFSLIFVVISTIIALKIAWTYKHTKNATFIFVGLAWLGMGKPWWGSTVSFIVALFNEIGLEPITYVLVNYAFISFFIIAWLIAVHRLMDFGYFKYIFSIILIISIIFELLILYFTFSNVSFLAVRINPVDYELGLLLILYLIFNLLLFIILGFAFSIASLRTEEPEIKIKGKILFFAFFIFLVGALLETLISFPPNRLILIVSAILFYIGLMMPKKIKKYIIREELYI